MSSRGGQLLKAGWSAKAVRHRTAGLRTLHDGVYLTSCAPPSQRQRWRAATLTAPRTVLSHASAGSCWGFRPHQGGFETITRPGGGGRRRADGLLILRSAALAGETTISAGLPVTTCARTLVDLAAHLPDRALRKAFREALRLRITTVRDALDTLDRHRGRRGTARLRALAERYARLHVNRTRSDAEAMALELLDDARLPLPEVNKRIAGEEADLSWPERRLIIEIDGPSFHMLRDEDARKTATWRAAGYAVRRIISDDVFDHPEALLALARA